MSETTSLKSNVILNIINTTVGLLFPLVTFPYVARVIMPEGIGQVQFFQSIINYIILLSALGIPLYAVREIARLKKNITESNKAAIEILLLHTLLCIIGYAIVFILIFSVDKIKSDWPLFLLLSVAIIFNMAGVAWYYQATEQFKYVTIRSLIVKLLSGIALFVFVRSQHDLYIYASILVCAEVGNNVFNFIRFYRQVSFKDFQLTELDVFRHLKPSLKIFMLNVAMSLYLNINPIMLGFLTDSTCVGYYTAVRKIISASNGLTVALGTALLPRLSTYFAERKFEEFKILQTKVLNIIIMLCLPLTVCMIIIAPVLIPVFSGPEYDEAILTLQLNAPAIIISALTYIVAIQILYSQNKENIVIISMYIAGGLTIVFNFLLIPILQQNGAAITACIGEAAVLTGCLCLGRHFINYNPVTPHTLQVIMATIVCATGVYLFGHYLEVSSFIILCGQILIGITLYCIVLGLLRNQILLSYYDLIKLKLRKK